MPKRAARDTLGGLFDPEGPFASAKSGYRERPQQVGLAREVAKTFKEKGVLLADAPRREYHRKLDGEQEARLVALACGQPPQGQARWRLRLLADKLVELEVVGEISYQTVGRVLKKTNSSRT